MATKNSPATDQRCGAQIAERRLSNGMRILVAERRLDPVVAVLLLYRVGSSDEQEGRAGVSHFLEHMMFKGSERFGKGEVDELTARAGGQNNAFTSYDHTGYWFEFASDRWEQALAIEADRMRALTLEPGEFESERAVVLEEQAMGEDDPWSVLGRKVESAVFQRHPYGRPIIGTSASLERMTRDEMADHHRRFYTPSNAILMVCGDVSVTQVQRAARRHFGDIPAGEAPERPFAAPLEEPNGETRIQMHWPDSGQRLLIGWPTIPVGERDDDVLDVVQTLLTGGRRARLQRRLVLDSELALSVTAHNDTRVASGAFWIMVDAKSSTTPDEVEAAIDEELEALASRSVTRAELKRAVAMLVAGEAHEGETVSDLAHELGGFAIDADWRMALDSERRLGDLTPREVRDTVRRLLDRRRRVVGWCTPEDRS